MVCKLYLKRAVGGGSEGAAVAAAAEQQKGKQQPLGWEKIEVEYLGPEHWISSLGQQVQWDICFI